MAAAWLNIVLLHSGSWFLSAFVRQKQTLKLIYGCRLVEYRLVAKWFLVSFSFRSLFCSSSKKTGGSAGLIMLQSYTLHCVFRATVKL